MSRNSGERAMHDAVHGMRLSESATSFQYI
jgi:hypothetical protein